MLCRGGVATGRSRPPIPGGLETLRVCCHCGQSLDSPQNSFDGGPGLRTIRVPSLPGKHLENISRSVLATMMAVKRYDVLHFHAIGPGILSGLTRLVGQPSIVTVHALGTAIAEFDRGEDPPDIYIGLPMNQES